ncbi:MAG TPA: hypothetical protein VN818_07040 [Gammaproteobacteria bacterium]|nr:hypothetical protein [Gammaproteobacteria bacterium]
MAGTVTSPLAIVRPWQEGDGSLEEMSEHVAVDLVLAEQVRPDNGMGDCIEHLEHDFWHDPCRFLRRACQVADYGATGALPEASESPRAPG